jgi:peroxiredoxin Q/BCP
MAQLRQSYAALSERGAEVIAIGPEDHDDFARQFRELDLPFVGLADPDHSVADLYGQQVSMLRFGRMPATVLVDLRGRIRWRHFGDSMRDIPEPKTLLPLLDELNESAGG